MKLINILFFYFIIQTTFCLAQTRYASWAELSKNAPEDLSARDYPVPTVSEVGIQPYPGAVISSVSAPREDTTNYDKQVLPFVILVTTDSPDKVVQFYKGILTADEGWNYSEKYTTFVKGEIISSLTGFVPSVAIREENGDEFDLIYVNEKFKETLKTRIKIFYSSNKTKE